MVSFTTQAVRSLGHRPAWSRAAKVLLKVELRPAVQRRLMGPPASPRPQDSAAFLLPSARARPSSPCECFHLCHEAHAVQVGVEAEGRAHWLIDFWCPACADRRKADSWLTWALQVPAPPRTQ